MIIHKFGSHFHWKLRKNTRAGSGISRMIRFLLSLSLLSRLSDRRESTWNWESARYPYRIFLSPKVIITSLRASSCSHCLSVHFLRFPIRFSSLFLAVSAQIAVKLVDFLYEFACIFAIILTFSCVFLPVPCVKLKGTGTVGGLYWASPIFSSNRRCSSLKFGIL